MTLFFGETLVITRVGLNVDRIDADYSSVGAVHALLQKPKDSSLRCTYYSLAPTSQEIVGARSIFSHIRVGTNDFVASLRFYDAVMPTLGYTCEDAGDSYAGYGLQENIGSGQNHLWLRLPADGEAATSGNVTNVALLAQSREQVDSFYFAALAAGAWDDGVPELRDVQPHYYATYVRDPDGHKLAVVCHRADG